MKDWKKMTISGNISIREAMKSITDAAHQSVFVVDENMKLLGMLTDGDIRRGLINGKELGDPAHTVMNNSPVTGSIEDSHFSHMMLMRQMRVRQLPLIDQEGVVQDIQFYDHFSIERKSTPVVIMAGGLGTRLGELTKDCPKPLLQVGGKPIIEHTVEQLSLQGYNNFYFCLNYKSEMFEKHFGDGAKHGINLNYILEEKRLGTAGALGLLPEFNEPFLVMNGDLLTYFSVSDLENSFQKSRAQATICVRHHEYQIPYGVIADKDGVVSSIDEKPVFKYPINTGIYFLDPSVTEFIPKDTYFDMTELLKKLLEKNQVVTTHSIDEFWLDIGLKEDYTKALEVFKK
jgi:dTDP-glucose pyrophosphorylase